MASQPKPSNQQLSYLVYWDQREYDLPSDEFEYELVLVAVISGPVEEKMPPRKSAGGPVRDMLELISRERMSKDEFDQLVAQLSSTGRVSHPMEIHWFESGYSGLQGKEKVELVEADVDLRTRDGLLLAVEARFPDELTQLGVDIFRSRLTPQKISHAQRRLWQLLGYLSPSLVQAVRREIGVAVAEHLHPEIDLLLAPRQTWSVVRLSSFPADHPSCRDELVRALRHDDAVYRKEQIKIIFGKQLSESLSRSGEYVYLPAKDETITKLIRRSGVRCVMKNYYSARQITHVMLPTALQQPRAEARYSALKEELLDIGIAVPDEPVVQYRALMDGN